MADGKELADKSATKEREIEITPKIIEAWARIIEHFEIERDRQKGVAKDAPEDMLSIMELCSRH